MPAALQALHCEIDGLDDDLGEFVLIDDLFKARAKDQSQKPLIAFSKSERGVSDFEFFTGSDLDRFIEHAASYYMQAGLRVVSGGRTVCSGTNSNINKRR